MYRHTVDLTQYLHTFVVGAYNVNAVKRVFLNAGWDTFANGRTLDEVVVGSKEDASL